MERCILTPGIRVLSCAIFAFALTHAATHEERFGNLPLAIEPGVNPGEFIAHAGKYDLRITAAGAAIGERRMRLTGCYSRAQPVLEDRLPGESHYLIGNDARAWRTHVPHYARLRFRGVYPGIDAVYYGNGRSLEFDFVAAPGADPRRIQLAFDGGLGEALEEPNIYQQGATGRRPIAGKLVRRGSRAAFQIAAWDRSAPLIIDPVISFSTLVGGGGQEFSPVIAVDSAGAVYVAGTTDSGNFPAVHAVSASLSSPIDAFVAKLNPAGTQLVYATYLGGSRSENPGAITIDPSGSAWIVGATDSP